MSISLTIDHSRQESGKGKRLEQLERWDIGETNQSPNDRALFRNGESSIKFQTGAIFLSACQTSDYEEIEKILKSAEGININYANSDGLTALHQASIDGNIKMVKYLLDHGADINVQDHEGWSCLHAASSCGYVEIAKILVEAGINILEVTSDGEIATDVAADESPKMKQYLDLIYKDTDGDFERTKEQRLMFEDAVLFYYYFKENGRKYDPEPVNPTTKAGPLHVAAAKGYLDVLRLLLESGFLPNSQDADGWTPLHAAAHWEQLEACRFLAAYGANFNLRNKLGQRPIDVADDSLIPEFTKLQRSRPQKENLPSLPDLPPPSPTKLLPDPPHESTPQEPVPPAKRPLETPKTPDISKREKNVPEKKSDAIPKTVKDSDKDREEQGSPWPITLKKASPAAATPPPDDEKKKKKSKEKYGVQDESVSLADAFNAFETGKPKTPRVKRASSTVDNPDDEQRRHMSQPVPNQLTNVERKDRAKKTRKSRRSTQGVTIDAVNQAKKLFDNLEAKRLENKMSVEADPNESNEKVNQSKLPSAYIKPSERGGNEDPPTVVANQMLNPNIARMMKIKEMSKKLKNTEPDAKALSKTKAAEKASIESSKSLDERVNAAIDELGVSNQSNRVDDTYQDQTVVRTTSSKQRHNTDKDQSTRNNRTPPELNNQHSVLQNSLSVESISSRQRTTSNSNSDTAANQRRSSNISSYPDHLSTIRSPVPSCRSPDGQHLVSGDQQHQRQSFGRRSPSHRNVSFNASDKPRKCRKMASQLLERIRKESSYPHSKINQDDDNDYRTMYDAEKRKLDDLMSRVLALEAEKEEWKAEKLELQEQIDRVRRTMQGSNNDANIDSQRIKDLEIELRERLEIEADNNKLKQENAALIRIISKLSK